MTDTETADTPPLVRMLGDTPKTKILAALLRESEYDHNVSDIADAAGVHRSTVYRHIEDLCEIGLVVETRQFNGGTMYQIDTSADTVSKLADLREVVA